MNAPGRLRLEPGRIDALAGLVHAITGRSLEAAPWLAPALLFADPAVQRQLALPRPGPDEILVHDYQSVAYTAPLRAGVDLTVAARRTDRGATAEFDVDLGHAGLPCAALKSALRRVPRRDVAGRVPARFSDRQTAGDAGRADGLRVSRAQVARYVDLSGDRNPIHTDAEDAASLGLAGPVVPGVLLLSLAQPFSPAGARLSALRGRFMAPLATDETFSVALVWRAPDRLRASFFAQDGRSVAVADIETAPRGAGGSAG